MYSRLKQEERRRDRRMYYLVFAVIFGIMFFNTPLGLLLLILAIAFYYFAS
jgi:membrane protein insertase Oxa1/YidC/SpoIIIJ